MRGLSSLFMLYDELTYHAFKPSNIPLFYRAGPSTLAPCSATRPTSPMARVSSREGTWTSSWPWWEQLERTSLNRARERMIFCFQGRERNHIHGSGSPCVIRPTSTSQADLADRDFAADRGQAVVIVSNGAVDPLAEERNEKERNEAEERHRHCLKLPRRPAWTPDMTAEELDLQVRGAGRRGGGYPWLVASALSRGVIFGRGALS